MSWVPSTFMWPRYGDPLPGKSSPEDPGPGGPGRPEDPGFPGAPGYAGGPGGAGRLDEAVRHALLARGIVLLRGPLDDATSAAVTAELTLLSSSTSSQGIALHLDSPGGPLHAAFAVMDTMATLPGPTTVCCVGRAEGTAVGVLAAGTRRLVAPHARIRLCAPSETASGSAQEMSAAVESHSRALEAFVDRLVEATGRPKEHVEADVVHGRRLDAEAAVAYGLADELWRPAGGGGGSDRPGPPLGFRPLS